MEKALLLLKSTIYASVGIALAQFLNVSTVTPMIMTPAFLLCFFPISINWPTSQCVISGHDSVSTDYNEGGKDIEDVAVLIFCGAAARRDLAKYFWPGLFIFFAQDAGLLSAS